MKSLMIYSVVVFSAILIVSCIDGNNNKMNQSNGDRIEQMKLDSIRQDSIAIKKFEEKIKKKKCYFLCFYDGMSESSYETAIKYLKSKGTLDARGYWIFATKNYEHPVKIRPEYSIYTSLGINSVEFDFDFSDRQVLNEVLQLYQSKYGASVSFAKEYSSMRYDQSKNEKDLFPDKNSAEYYEGMNDETNTYEMMYYYIEKYEFNNSITSVSVRFRDHYLYEKVLSISRYNLRIIYSAYEPPIVQPPVDKIKIEKEKEINRVNTRNQI